MFDPLAAGKNFVQLMTIPKGADMQSVQKTRPKYYDLNLLHLPPPGMVSILHRVTGVAMLLFLIPFALLALQHSLLDESKFDFTRNVLNFPLVKLIVLGLLWAYLHHLFACIRYLFLDVHIGIAKEPARNSAVAVLVLGFIATAVIGARIW